MRLLDPPPHFGKRCSRLTVMGSRQAVFGECRCSTSGGVLEITDSKEFQILEGRINKIGKQLF